METTIWILKGAIALLFTFIGLSKLFLPKAKLLDMGMKGLLELSQEQIRVAGSLEFLGTLGLILPSLLNVYPVLSGIAALCLGMTMIVAGVINFRLKLSIVPNVLILGICVFIAVWELM